MNKIAVIGGSLAGVHAAESLRDHGYEGELVIVSADTDAPYDRPPLSKDLLLGRTTIDQLDLRPGSWYADRDIRLRLGTAAVGLDTAEQTVALSDGDELPYDGLVIATGSVARPLPVDALTAPAHLIRTLPDALELLPKLNPGRHIAVIGGGFIGLEVAGVARQLGLEVTLVERSLSPLLRAFGEDVARWYRKLHEANGVRFVCLRELTSVAPSVGGVVLGLNDGTTLAADILVAGVGASPAVDWLRGSAVEVANGVECTPDLLTSVPNIVAAGDVVHWRNPVFDEQMRVEHWSNAIDQGRHAAATLLGHREPFASVPYFWTDQHAAKMRFVGRAALATEHHIAELGDTKLVVRYGRAGRLVGALCVNAPKAMAYHKSAIQQQTPWLDIAA